MANLETTKEQIILLDEIQDELECVVCLDTPGLDPIYQCEQGHLLCKSCHGKLTDCPICKAKLGNTRCLAAEKILAKYPRRCEFQAHGCSIKLPKTAIEDHQMVCIYKPLRCPSLNCEERLPIIETLNHMDDKHGIRKEIENFPLSASFPNILEIIKNKKSFKFEPIRIRSEGRFFYSECWRSCKGRWYMWVYMLGTPTESKSYIFTVKLLNPNRVEQFSYTGQCVSLHIELDQIGTTGRCLTFHDDTAKHFCFDDNIPVQIDVQRNPTAQND